MKKSRIMTALVTAALCGVMLTGCGNSSGDASNAASTPDNRQETETAKDAAAGDAGQNAGSAQADDVTFDEAITVVVPYKAGGGNDTNMRLMAGYAEKYFGTTMVIENVPGGSTLTGAAQVLGGEADGYTVFANSCTGLLASPQMFGGSYELTDWIPVVSQNTVECVLVAGPAAPVKDSLDEIVAYIKEHPGEVTVGCGGLSDITGFQASIAFNAMDCEINLIPFDGAAESLENILGGHIMYDVIPVSVCLSSIKNGDLTAVVEVSGISDNACKVPTLGEAGYPDGECAYYRVICVPAGTPDAMVEKLRECFTALLQDPDVIQAYEDANDALTSPIFDAAELQKKLEEDWDIYGKIIEELDLGI